MKMEEDMDEADDLAAQKEALGFIRNGLRERSLRSMSKPDGNVGEVMEREPEIEAVEEEEMGQPEAEADEPERRTILESFTPKTIRVDETLHVKRGPGRPRKMR